MIEVTTFRPLGGVADADLVAADHQVQIGFAPYQPGFARRTTAVADDGTWAVVTLWYDAPSADAAASAGASDPSVQAFLALVDPTTVTTRRYHELPG